jgi:hypothetical protein
VRTQKFFETITLVMAVSRSGGNAFRAQVQFEGIAEFVAGREWANFCLAESDFLVHASDQGFTV